MRPQLRQTACEWGRSTWGRASASAPGGMLPGTTAGTPVSTDTSEPARVIAARPRPFALRGAAFRDRRVFTIGDPPTFGISGTRRTGRNGGPRPTSSAVHASLMPREPLPALPAMSPGRLEHIRRLVAYDRQVFERFERSVQRRGWRAATKEREIGHHTFKDTLVHILNVHEAWAVAIDQGRWEIFDVAGRQPAEVRSWAELRQYRTRVWEAVDVYVHGLRERDLDRRVKAPWMPGRYTVEDSFYQASVEQAHHLGEIIGAFWQNDWAPPKMTWIENQPRQRRR